MFILDLIIRIYIFFAEIKFKILERRMERATNRLFKSYSNIDKPYKEFKEETIKCMESASRIIK